MRKLASIQTIWEVQPIEGADRIEVVSVPIEETGDQLPYKTVDDFIERAKGKYKSGSYKEGIVIRPLEPVYSKILEGPLWIRPTSLLEDAYYKNQVVGHTELCL